MHRDADVLPPSKLRIPTPSWVIVVGLVLAAAALNFDQLLIHLSDRLPGQSLADSVDAIWHLWWAGFGFAQSDGLVINAWTGAPYLSNHLANLPILQGVLFRLLDSFLSPVAAFNLLLILSQIATHFALFLFLRSRSGSVIASGLAATAFVLSPWYVDALIRVDLIASGLWPVPLALLAWDRWLIEPNMRRSSVTVLILTASVLSGMLHLAWLLALFLPYALWTGFSERHRLSHDPALSKKWATMALVFMIILMIYPLPAVVRTLLGNEPPFGPAQPLAPAALTSFFGPILDSGPVIWLAAAISLIFIRDARRVAFWLIGAGLYFLYGIQLLPEPWRMLAGALALPYQSLYPDDVFLGLALFNLLLIPLAHWQTLIARRSPWQLAALSGGVLALVLASSPALTRTLPLQSIQSAPIYNDIAAEPEDYLILTYPSGLYSRIDHAEMGSGADLSLYAVWHHKRMIGGTAPYFDPLIFERFSAMPFMVPSQPTLDPGAAAALTEAINTWRIGYVIVYLDRLSPDEVDRIDALLSDTDALSAPDTQDGLRIYRACWHPGVCQVQTSEGSK